jgi:hypothetical protein
MLPLQVRLLSAGKEGRASAAGAAAVEAVAIQHEEVQLQGGHHEAQDVGDEDVRVTAYYEPVRGPGERVAPHQHAGAVRQRGSGLVSHHGLEGGEVAGGQGADLWRSTT